jgi:hypothetical protein
MPRIELRQDGSPVVLVVRSLTGALAEVNRLLALYRGAATSPTPDDDRLRPASDSWGDRCRWNAYTGQPLLLDELLFRTQHGLIDQSLHSRMGTETTNGDEAATHGRLCGAWGPFRVHKLVLRRVQPSIRVCDLQPFLSARRLLVTSLL